LNDGDGQTIAPEGTEATQTRSDPSEPNAWRGQVEIDASTGEILSLDLPFHSHAEPAGWPPFILNGKTVRSFSTDDIANLTTTELRSIEANAFAQLSTDQMAAFSPAQVGRMRFDQIGALRPKQLRAMSGEQLQAIRPFSIAAIKPGRLTNLSAAQAAAFTPEQLAAMTPEQVAKLTPDHFASFNNDQLRAFNSEQRAAMRSAQSAKLDPQRAELLQTGGQPNAPTTGNVSGRIKDLAVRYGPYLGANVTLAATVPPEILMVGNGAGFVLRGVGTTPLALAPKLTGRDTKLGRSLSALNAFTFVLNGAYHTSSYGYGDGTPYNQLYTISDHTGGVQNAHQAITGNAYTPSKVEKYAGMTTMNVGNAFLMATYSVPAGPDAWVPNVLFGSGAAYLAYKGVRADIDAHRAARLGPGDTTAATRQKSTGLSDATKGRLATGAVGVGLLGFGTHYLIENAFSADQAEPAVEENPPPSEEEPQESSTPPQPNETDGPTEPTSPSEPAPEEPDEQPQLVVTANEGLNLRDEPKIGENRITAFQPGTLIEETGERETDETGREWVAVRGRDWAGNEHEGWVCVDYVEPHEEGEQTQRGRINPDLENGEYERIEVKRGQTLGSIARERSIDTADAIMLNDHIFDPNVIFEGDRIYLPSA